MYEKTVSRIISIIALFLMNVTLIVLSLCSGFGKFCILVVAFSSFAALCNLIMFIIIMCLECCTNNRFYNSSGEQTKLCTIDFKLLEVFMIHLLLNINNKILMIKIK